MYFISIIPVTLGLLLNIISSVKVKKRAELLLVQPYTPLPDLIHDIFPKIPTISPDYLLNYFLIKSILYYNYLTDIEKNILCVGICLMIRSCSVFLTILPTCMPRPITPPSTIYSKLFLSTHDLMFSGHAIIFIGIGQIWNNITIQVVGPLLLVLARQHYTIDVCVSGLVYYCIFKQLDNYI